MDQVTASIYLLPNKARSLRTVGHSKKLYIAALNLLFSSLETKNQKSIGTMKPRASCQYFFGLHKVTKASAAVPVQAKAA